MRALASLSRLTSWGLAPVTALLWVVVVGSSSCTTVVPPDQPEQKTCTSDAQCGDGLICAAGACVVGTCDPVLEDKCDRADPRCCKPWENCDPVSFACVADPNAKGIGCSSDDPTCKPCEVDNDCQGIGEFCSGARCFTSAGRTNCTQSFQCGANERCDRTVFLCVPDSGGCKFCSDFPELCCEQGQLCNQETGFCVGVGDQECTVDNEATNCHPGQKCDTLGRCVQCTADADCGPGLACNEGTGSCFSILNACQSDDNCVSPRRCAPATLECVQPVCTADSQCTGGDPRKKCNLDLFQCFLPPPVCQDEDNAHNQTTTAIPLTNAYAGFVCRGGSTFFTFDAQPSKRYTATVTFAGGGNRGVQVALLDGNQVIQSSKTFDDSTRQLTVTAVTGSNDVAGPHYLRIVANADQFDERSISVSLAESDVGTQADCSVAGQTEEPNNAFAIATPLTLGTTQIFGRCGTDDVDVYRIDVPALNGIDVVMGGFLNGEGNLNIELFTGPTEGQRVAQGTTVNDVEHVTAVEGPTTYFVRVTLGASSGALANQTYSLTPTLVPRPAACTPDPTEPDGTTATAAAFPMTSDINGLASGSLTHVIRCNPQDLDIFRFTMPALLGGNATATFTQSEGDIALDLLDATGAVLKTSNTSNALNGSESIELPQAAVATDYFLRIRLGSGLGTTGQQYALAISTFDASTCVLSEPVANDVFTDGVCLGTFTTDHTCKSGPVSLPLAPGDLAACGTLPAGTPGCGRACAVTDDDWYRVGVLNNGQVLHAHLQFAPEQGALAVVLGRLNSVGGTVQFKSIHDNAAGDLDPTVGTIDVRFVAPTTTDSLAREHAVLVHPEGGAGYSAELYALQVDVSGACLPDAFEGTLGNSTPSLSTLLRPNPTPGFSQTVSASLCASDVDVYELFAFAGETVHVTVSGLPGASFAIGTRPANLDTDAVTVANGTGVDPIAATFSNPTAQQLYFTLKPGADAALGSYSLQFDIAAPTP